MKIDERKGRWLSLACLFLAVALPVLPVLSQREFILQHDVFLSDLLHNQFPYRAYLGRHLSEGVLPLWLPDVYSGVPFLAQIEAGVLYLPNWILFGLFEPYLALGLTVFSSLLLGAGGAYALARHYGAGTLGAALAGFVFAYCGFNVSHIRHLNMHAAAALLSWMVLCFERGLATRRWRWFALTAFLLCQQVFAGHPQITHIALVWMGALLVVRVVACWRAERRAGGGELAAPALLAAGGAAAIGIGLGLAAIQLLPTLAFNATSMRGGDLSWTFATQYSYHLPDLVTFFVPEATGTFATGDYEGVIEWEGYGYCGLLVLPLAGFAAWRLRRETTALFLVASVVAGMLLVVGPATPLYRLAWSAVPGMDMFRFPSRYLLVVDLSLALLAGLGFTSLWRSRKSRSGHVALLVVLAIVFADLWFWQMRRVPMDDAAAWRDPGPVVEAIQAAGQPGRVYVVAPEAHWQKASDMSEGFVNGFDLYRQAGSLPLGNQGLLHDIVSVDGYVNMLSTRNGAFWQHYNESLLPFQFRPAPFDPDTRKLTPELQSILDRAAVRYVVSHINIQDDHHELLWSGGPFGLFANKTALPRAYLAGQWRGAASFEEAAEWILQDGAQRTSVPVIEGAPASADGGMDILALELEEVKPHELEVELAADAAGWVVITDTWDAGWEARIDGQPVPISIANGYQMAVPCAAGSERLSLVYWPPGMSKGLAMSLVAFFSLFLGALPWRLARRRVERTLSAADPS